MKKSLTACEIAYIKLLFRKKNSVLGCRLMSKWRARKMPKNNKNAKNLDFKSRFHGMFMIKVSMSPKEFDKMLLLKKISWINVETSRDILEKP